MKKFLFAFVTVLTSLALFPLPTFAATTTHQIANGHCVIQLAPIASGKTVSDMMSQSCFSTFSQAISFATGGKVTATKPQDVTSAQLASTSDASTSGLNVISILWSDQNYQGNSETFTTSGPSCSSSASYGFTSMPSGWDKVVSSFQGGYYGCTWTRLFSNTNYGGASQCYSGDSSYVGDVMNDQTSSITWNSNSTC